MAVVLSSGDRLLFVYNVDSSLGRPFGALREWTHAFVSPTTFTCRLWTLTHNRYGALLKKWRLYLDSLPTSQSASFVDEINYLYRNEIENKLLPKTTALPCVLLERKRGESLHVLVSSEDINRMETLDQLIDACSLAIEPYLKH